MRELCSNEEIGHFVKFSYFKNSLRIFLTKLNSDSTDSLFSCIFGQRLSIDSQNMAFLVVFLLFYTV